MKQSWESHTSSPLINHLHATKHVSERRWLCCIVWSSGPDEWLCQSRARCRRSSENPMNTMDEDKWPRWPPQAPHVHTTNPSRAAESRAELRAGVNRSLLTEALVLYICTNSSGVAVCFCDCCQNRPDPPVCTSVCICYVFRTVGYRLQCEAINK